MVVVISPRTTRAISASSRRHGKSEAAYPELRSQIIRICLVHLLPAREDMLQLIMIGLVYPLFQRFVASVFEEFEGG